MPDAGRAIFVTCGEADGRSAYWGPYAASKAALESLVRSYAAEITKTKVRANLICPGPTRTGLRDTAFPGEDPNSLPAPEEICEPFVELASPACDKNGEVVKLA